MTGIRWLRRGVGLVALLLVVEYLLLPQLAGAGPTMHVLAGLRAPYLVAGIGLEVAALLAYSLLTRAVLPPAGRPGLAMLAGIDVTTLGVSHVLPGGSAGANALRYRLLTQAGVRGNDAVFGAVVQGVGSAVVLNLLLWLALLLAIPHDGMRPLFAIGAVLGAALFTMAAVLVLAFTQGQRHTVALVRWVADRIPRLTGDGAEAQIRRVTEHLRAFGHDRRLLARACGWAAANWLLDAASLWTFTASFGYTVDAVRLFIAFGLANVLAAIPVTPGGLGVVEGVLVPTLVGAGAPHGVAILGVISWRLVNFWLPIPTSGAAYLAVRARLRRRVTTHRTPTPA